MRTRTEIFQEVLFQPKTSGELHKHSKRFLKIAVDFVEKHEKLQSPYKDMYNDMIRTFVDGAGLDKSSFTKKERIDFTAAYILVECTLDIWAREMKVTSFS